MADIPDRFTQQQTDDQYAEYLEGPIPRCPLCKSRKVRKESDHDKEGNVTASWMHCENCGHDGPLFIGD